MVSFTSLLNFISIAIRGTEVGPDHEKEDSWF